MATPREALKLLKAQTKARRAERLQERSDHHYASDRERLLFKSPHKILMSFRPKSDPSNLPYGYVTRVVLTPEDVAIIEELPNFNRHWIEHAVDSPMYNNHYWHTQAKQHRQTCMRWRVGNHGWEI